MAAITVPSDGSDGALVIPSNTNIVIDLSQAVDAAWDANNAANAGSGVYDADQWAVVFKYTSVTIPEDSTVTFANHPTRPPVVWLVSGDVTIDGTVNLTGEQYQPAPDLSEPGPGGFRGGQRLFTEDIGRSAGFGVGGGFYQSSRDGQNASFGGTGQIGPRIYGNPSLIPLIGGSGGSGSDSYGGGAGGGAILIASGGTITLNGTLQANGGAARGGWTSGSGSGGGIRLVCDNLAGDGVLQAIGSSGGYDGGIGRIRIERRLNANTIQVSPDPSVIGLEDGAIPLIFPPANAPSVEILSVGAEAIPADPQASFGTFGADATIGLTNMTEVVIQTINVEQVSELKVRVTPRSDANATVVDAAVDSVVNTDPLTLLWKAEIPVRSGYSALQVHVIRP